MFPKIGLALGGGGARGFAHIGILKVLERHHIKVNYLSGTSMGGIIAAAYAAGYSPTDLENEARKKTQTSELIKLIDPVPPRRGLLKGNRVQDYLTDLLGDCKSFEDLEIPLVLNAVDLNSGELIYFSHGDLLPALFATICIPGVFPPIQYQGRCLVDGGVLNNLPIQPIRALGADIVIAVDVESQFSCQSAESNTKSGWPFSLTKFLFDLQKAEFLMVSKLTQIHLKDNPADILIQPLIPDDINFIFGFPKGMSALEAGESAGEQAIPTILEYLNEYSVN